MKKVKINGTVFVPEAEIREELRHLRRSIGYVYSEYSELERDAILTAYNDVIKALYYDELRAAKTKEERDAILEMPGDFVVARRAADPTVRKLDFFSKWEDKFKPVIGDSKDALWFSYESMAENIADRLNELLPDGWRVYDMSEQEAERNKRLLEAIFSDDDGMEDDDSGTC